MSECGWKHAGTYMYQPAHTVTKNRDLVISMPVTSGCPRICQIVQNFVLIKPIGLCGPINAQNFFGPLRHILTLPLYQAEVPDFWHCRGGQNMSDGSKICFGITGSTKTNWFN